MNKLFVLLFLLTAITGLARETKKHSPEDLEKWQRIGLGNALVTHGQFLMEEVENSRGFMILSPEKYKDVVVRYEVMTLNPATVLVAILNASDIGGSAELSVTEHSDSFGFWVNEVEDYMFGFRVMAHNTTPFIRKHPVPEGGNAIIGLAEKDVMLSGWRHTVECGRDGRRLWLSIDGATIIDIEDDEPLNEGKIALRVRGTAGELGKCLIRNLEIEGIPVK